MERRYLLVCRGPTCASQGSVEVREALRAALAAAGDTSVVVLPYTCFDRCGHGPNAVLYPDGEWFEALGLENVPDLVEHVRGRQPAPHLMAAVDERQAEEYYQMFEDVIPDLEAEVARAAEPKRRDWPGALRTLFRKG
ncbi:MAG: hypothetical protein ACRDIY_04390 [Chloroflexota bacterium]